MSNMDDFLNAYRDNLIATYAWAADAAKLERFMASCERTIGIERANTWNHDGAAVTEAWRECGQKGKPTLKALRAFVAS